MKPFLVSQVFTVALNDCFSTLKIRIAKHHELITTKEIILTFMTSQEGIPNQISTL
jgi:hypothetical protein